jgi:hypothetical protein
VKELQGCRAQQTVPRNVCKSRAGDAVELGIIVVNLRRSRSKVHKLEKDDPF